MSPREWKRLLERWHSPRSFREKIDELRSEYGCDVLTRAGLTDVFRDAYPAGLFASIRGADRVRLTEAVRPDFEIDLSAGTRMYEVVEADTPGRKRSEEMRKQSQTVTDGALLKDFYLTSELAPQILHAAAKKKNSDRYVSEWGLLIYLNPCRPGGEEELYIENGMVEATAAVKDRFADVWVLWEGTAYNTWQKSAPGNVVLRPANPFVEAADFVPESLSSILAGR